MEIGLVAEDFQVAASWSILSQEYCPERGGNGYVIEDLGSTNGTYLNRRKARVSMQRILALPFESQLGRSGTTEGS